MKREIRFGVLVLLGSCCFFSSANAANVTITSAGRVTLELISSDAQFRNTLSVISPAVSIAANGGIELSGCKLEPADGLGGLRVLSEKLSQRGCRVDLDSDPGTAGIQGFVANTTFELGMCAQTDGDAQCEFVWSSDPSNNSDDDDHVQTTVLATNVFQLAWEDNEDLGDMDFNDLVVVLRVQVDTDGDGLWDDWELSGIDTNGDGVTDFDLAALGANPMRRNVFLEVDFMDCGTAGGDCAAGDTHSHQPKMAAINAVVAAFANAPVTNPDGTTGITLRVEVDDAVAHQNSLAVNCSTGDWTNFDNLKADAANFGTANPRRFTHHYVVFSHRLGNTTSSGCGELPGNDFIVTLGEWNTTCITWGPNTTLDTTTAGGDDLIIDSTVFAGPNLTCNTNAVGDDVQNVANGSQPNNDPDGDGVDDRTVGTVQQQAGTLLHEFGHNLQLCHGGVYDPPLYGQCNTNFKPSYISIMNYAFQTRGIPPTDPDGPGALQARVDLSNDVLPSCVGPGGNGVLNTVAGGDDTVSGNFVRSGPDGTCDTNAAGDDVQMVASGNAAALNENGLNETTGIGDGTDNTRYLCAGVAGFNLGAGVGPIDWNCDADGGADPAAVVDVNGDGAMGMLPGWNDWANLRYDFQATGDFEDGVHETSINVIEIDFPTQLLIPLGIDIDIHPFGNPNSINTRARGVIPIAICNGGAVINSVAIDNAAIRNGFSGAATNINVGTIRFTIDASGSPAHDLGEVVVLGDHLTDFVDTDGDDVADTLIPLSALDCDGDPAGPDLVVHIPVQSSGLAFGDTMACLTAELMDGTRIVGCDAVRIVR